MNTPEGMTEQDVLEIIEKIACNLCDKFKFGYHETADMKQQIRLYAIEILNKDKYDKSRPLDNYLYICVRNKLFNDKRDKFERLDKPCHHCPISAWVKETDSCTDHEDKLNCSLYERWYTKNIAKKGLMNPLGMGSVNDEQEPRMKKSVDFENNFDNKELFELIDKEIPIELRHDWLRLKDGVSVAKNRRAKLLEKIRSIVHEQGIKEGQNIS